MWSKRRLAILPVHRLESKLPSRQKRRLRPGPEKNKSSFDPSQQIAGATRQLERSNSISRPAHARNARERAFQSGRMGLRGEVRRHSDSRVQGRKKCTASFSKRYRSDEGFSENCRGDSRVETIDAAFGWRSSGV